MFVFCVDNDHGCAMTTKVLETSSAEVAAIEKEKKIIFAAQPHGVMSVTGICSAINYVSVIYPWPAGCFFYVTAGVAAIRVGFIRYSSERTYNGWRRVY